MLEKLNKGIKVLIAALGFVFLSATHPGLAFAQEEATSPKNYEITGSWSGLMKGSVDSTFGLGNSFGISAAPPVFDQEVDLSALIHITPQFYFEFEFLDKFYNNTYTLGYNGTGYLKEFKFSNRQITFPEYYSSSINDYKISGGKNEAPGVMFHFEDYETEKWKGDILLRYDMTEQKTALFYGNNSVKDITTELYNFVHSNTFVIPSDALFHIRDIYIQMENGDYSSDDKLEFHKLSPQDYIIDSQKKLLVLSDSVFNFIKSGTTPYILITFDDPSFCNTLLTQTGSYSDPSSFAGQIQSFFNTNGQSIDLSDYSTLNYASLTKTIEGTTAFIIQSPEAFSPYLCANRYKVMPQQESEYLVIDKDTQSTQALYSARTQNDFYFSQTDYFDDKLYYVTISNLAYKTTNTDSLAPQTRYPFADKYPELYLKPKTELPVVFSQRTTTPVKNFDIGKKASAGTVRVYKNGVLLAGTTYDSGTGFVTINESINELDKILIVYEEESLDSSKGFVTTGTGFVYNILPSLVFDTSFTGKYQATDSLDEVSENSFSVLTNGLSYKGKYLSAYDAVSTGIETQKEASDSFITKNQAGISFKNDQAFAQAVSSQGITVNTSNGQKVSDYINTDLKGGITFAGIQTGADVSLSYIDLKTAGHSVTTQKPLFDFLDFGEIYRFSNDELEKKDYIGLTVKPLNFNISALTSSKSSLLSNKQNYLIESSTTIKTATTSHTGILKFSADQVEKPETETASESNTARNSNYFISWYDISKNQFNTGKDNSIRNTVFFAKYKSSYEFLKLSPDISFELSGNNQNTEQKDFLAQDTLNFSVPFSTANNAFSFSLVHKGTVKNQNIINHNYKDDIEKIFDLQKDFDFFYTAIPFYSLFDSQYKTNVQKPSGSAEGSLEYNLAWRRKLFNDIKDLYIPISATAGISRDVIHTAEKTTDTLQIKARLSSNFINLFGSNSSLQLYDWYRQEEYTGFVNAVFKLSPGTNTSPYFQISSGELITFYIQDSNVLNINTDFYIDNYINWTFKTAAAWSRKTEKSLLLALTHLCWKESLSLDLSPKVTDSFSISLSTQNKIHKEIYSYLRSSEITFKKNFNLTSAAGLSFGYEQGKTFRLGLNYELGLKIQF